MHGEMEEQRKRRDNKRGAIFCTKMQKKRKKIETRRRYTERYSYRKNVWMWSRGSCKDAARANKRQEQADWNERGRHRHAQQRARRYPHPMAQPAS